jgi:hypothetical protein
MITRTHTRTHVHVTFANPYLTCEHCKAWVTGWHDPDRCGPGCSAPAVNLPCGHQAGVTSACPSWGPVDGCQCREFLGHVPHAEPQGGPDDG